MNSFDGWDLGVVVFFLAALAGLWMLHPILAGVGFCLTLMLVCWIGSRGAWARKAPPGGDHQDG